MAWNLRSRSTIGLIDITDTLLEGWRPGTDGVRIMRDRSTVTLGLDVHRVGVLGGSAEVIPIPEGFRPIAPGYLGQVRTQNRVIAWWDRAGARTPLRIRDQSEDLPDGDRIRVSLTWTTVDPMPRGGA